MYRQVLTVDLDPRGQRTSPATSVTHIREQKTSETVICYARYNSDSMVNSCHRLKIVVQTSPRVKV